MPGNLENVLQRQRLLRQLAAFASLVLALGWSTEADAVEEALSPYLKGASGFMAGYLPPEPYTFVFNPLYYHLDGSAGASVRNGHAEFGVDVDLNAGLFQGLYTTGWKLFGATYAVSGAVTYIGANVTANLGTTLGTANVSEGTNDMGDSFLSPIVLGWHTGNFHVMTGPLIYIPTGHYAVRTLSVGKNTWSFMPQAALTWFDPKSGWDISGAMTLVFSTKNDATDYQSGDIFHFDWGIGKHLGAWEIGVQGNVMAQFTGDSGTGARLGSFEATSVGLGPAVSYSTMIGKTPLSLTAKWEPDVTATNTYKGNVAMFSVAAVF